MKITANNMKNKKITILGAGLSGIAAAKLATYFEAQVFISDIKRKPNLKNDYITFELGEHTKRCLECDLVIVSPGISKNIKIIKEIESRDIPIISEIEFASWFTTSPIIGVTGSNGKSTTVSILKNIFSKKYNKAYLGGNIGVPFSSNVLNEIRIKNKKPIHILELSSFQLENVSTFKPNLACILNLSEDHLDRYNSVNDYYLAKINILKNLNKNSFFVFNTKDEKLYKRFKDKTQFYGFNLNEKHGNFILNNKNHIIEKNTKKIILDTKKMHLKGTHNIENILASINIAKLFNIETNIICSSILSFKPLRHRMESIQSNKKILFINDSKGTNPRSTIKAIKSSNKKTILILGGYSKGKIDYKKIFDISLNNIKKIICYGEEGKNIYKQLKNIFKSIYIMDFEKAVVHAIKTAKDGYRVLLSPACSSFDQFNNFEERGNKFRDIIQTL